MRNPDDYVPTLAETNEAYRQVGRFIGHWALLESSLNRGLCKLLGLKTLEGSIVAANMQFRAKVHIIKTLINLVGSRSQWRPAAIKNIDAIGAMSDHRNIVAHVPFGPFKGGGVEFLPVKAKGKLAFPDTVWTATDFTQKCDEIAKLSDGLDETVKRLCATRSLFEFFSTKGAPQGLEPQNALLRLLQGRPDFQTATPETEIETPQKPKGE